MKSGDAALTSIRIEASLGSACAKEGSLCRIQKRQFHALHQNEDLRTLNQPAGYLLQSCASGNGRTALFLHLHPNVICLHYTAGC